jgi:hypothetical protein
VFFHSKAFGRASDVIGDGTVQTGVFGAGGVAENQSAAQLPSAAFPDHF